MADLVSLRGQHPQNAQLQVVLGDILRTAGRTAEANKVRCWAGGGVELDPVCRA